MKRNLTLQVVCYMLVKASELPIQIHFLINHLTWPQIAQSIGNLFDPEAELHNLPLGYLGYILVGF